MNHFLLEDAYREKDHLMNPNFLVNNREEDLTETLTSAWYLIMLQIKNDFILKYKTNNYGNKFILVYPQQNLVL